MNTQLFIGKSKHAIKQLLNQNGESYSEFLYWLFIPKHQLLLSFDGQICHSGFITPAVKPRP